MYLNFALINLKKMGIKACFIQLLILTFLFSVIAPPFAEASLYGERRRTIWQERKASVEKIKEDQLKNLNKNKPEALLLAQIPSNFNSLPLPQKNISSSLIQSLKQELPKESLEPLATLLESVPSQYGTISKIQIPKNKKIAKTVLYIQDVHLNPEVQTNISKTIQSLIDSKKINLIALEGAFEEIDLTHFRTSPYPEAIQKSTDYLFRQKKISGAIHTALTSPKEIPPIVGIDDHDHYWAHVNSYKQSVGLVAQYKKELTDLKLKINQEKEKGWNQKLKDFDQQVDLYQKGTIKLGDYLSLLSSQNSQNYPSIQNFLKALKLENSLNFSQVAKEREFLVKNLVPLLTNQQIQEFMQQTLHYRTGEIGHSDYYQVLKNLCLNHGIELSQYPALTEYLRYVLLSDSIQSENLFTEIKELEKRNYDSLTKNDEEKRLVKKSRRLYLTEKLLNFTLTKEEWEDYEELKFMSANPITPNPNLSSLTSFESFYKEGLARDQLMAKNLIRTLQNDTPLPQSFESLSVLVTGGFHSTGIAQLLNKAGFAVITFTPKLTQVDTKNGAAYLSVFTQEKTPLEKLFSGEKLSVPPPTYPKKVLPPLIAAIAAGFLVIVSPQMTSAAQANSAFYSILGPEREQGTKIEQVKRIPPNKSELLFKKPERAVRLTTIIDENKSITNAEEEIIKNAKEDWLKQFLLQVRRWINKRLEKLSTIYKAALIKITGIIKNRPEELRILQVFIKNGMIAFSFFSGTFPIQIAQGFLKQMRTKSTRLSYQFSSSPLLLGHTATPMTKKINPTVIVRNLIQFFNVKEIVKEKIRAILTIDKIVVFWAVSLTTAAGAPFIVNENYGAAVAIITGGLLVVLKLTIGKNLLNSRMPAFAGGVHSPLNFKDDLSAMFSGKAGDDSPDSIFSERERMAKKLQSLMNGIEKVSLIVDLSHGLGDELIFFFSFGPAIRAKYPHVKINVYTRRPWLWHAQPGIEIIGRSYPSEEEKDLWKEKGTLVIFGSPLTSNYRYEFKRRDVTVTSDKDFAFAQNALKNHYAWRIFFENALGIATDRKLDAGYLINKESSLFREAEAFVEKHSPDPTKPRILFNGMGGEFKRKGFESAELLAEFISSLVEKTNGYVFVVLNDRTNQELLDNLRDHLKSNLRLKAGQAVLLPPTLEDKYLSKHVAALVDMGVTVEGGMMHLLYALGKPFVSLHNLPQPFTFGIYGYYPVSGSVEAYFPLEYDKRTQAPIELEKSFGYLPGENDEMNQILGKVQDILSIVRQGVLKQPDAIEVGDKSFKNPPTKQSGFTTTEAVGFATILMVFAALVPVVLCTVNFPFYVLGSGILLIGLKVFLARLSMHRKIYVHMIQFLHGNSLANVQNLNPEKFSILANIYQNSIFQFKSLFNLSSLKLNIQRIRILIKFYIHNLFLNLPSEPLNVKEWQKSTRNLSLIFKWILRVPKFVIAHPMMIAFLMLGVHWIIQNLSGGEHTVQMLGTAMPFVGGLLPQPRGKNHLFAVKDWDEERKADFVNLLFYNSNIKRRIEEGLKEGDFITLKDIGVHAIRNHVADISDRDIKRWIEECNRRAIQSFREGKESGSSWIVTAGEILVAAIEHRDRKSVV